MAEFIQEYKFKNPPKEIIYYNDKPLELNNKFAFYHNKSKFRKEVNRLQYLFQNYLKTPLIATGIRDSYLKKEYTEKYSIILFTTNEIVKETNQIIELHLDKTIPPGCFYLENNSKYLLLLTKNIDGLILGIDTMEEIFVQTFEHYFMQKKFDEYIKIRPFKIVNCLKSS